MEPFGWKRAVRAAETIVADAKKLTQVLEEGVKKMNAHSGALAAVLADLQLIVRLVRAWMKGDYRDVSNKSLVLLVGALLYFLMPIDAIPDFIPGVGFLDDAGVIAMALAAAKTEIDKFRSWEIRG
ncbi:MAG TPA: YkvA family protein [Candidatus Binatia bacterium]|jgi:uncharacterized membrane protein YkvA (DUF1232 family)